MNQKIKSNIWKFFLYSLSQRRNFIPILGIYFLTLPNTSAKQIGFYISLGFFVSFLLEIPSGYFSDNFGHKKTLILSKVFMLSSLLCYIFAKGISLFLLGSTLQAISLALGSGTREAFMHETLKSIKQERNYSKIMSKIAANVSLVSVFLILSLPFFTAINIRLPLQIGLLFDLMGLITTIFLINPTAKIKIGNKKSIFELLKEGKKNNFYSISIFLGAITGFAMAHSAFRPIYLENLGLPIIFIGSIMGISRIFWFLIGHKAHLIEEKTSIKKHLLIETIIFPLYFIIIGFFSNIYFLIFIMALVNGYMQGRNQITKNYLLKRIHSNNYKATMLSIQSQISSIFQFTIAFIIGFVFEYSFKIGFYVLGISLFLILLITYQFIQNKH